MLLRKLVIDMCNTVRLWDDVNRVVVVFDTHSWRYNFYSDYKNYIVLAVFTLIMFPVFAQLFKLLDVYINNSYDKELSKIQVRAKRKEILSRLRGNRLQKD